MASLFPQANGHWWIQYKDTKRRTIRLGKVPKAMAEEFKRRVELLLAAKLMNNPVDADTARWVGSLSKKFRHKLAKAELCRATGASTVGELIDQHKAAFAGKPSTKANLAGVYSDLRRYFGDAKPLAAVSPGDARDYKAWLSTLLSVRGKRLARTTVSRRVRRAKQIFEWAVDHWFIPENPFDKLRGWSEKNRERDFFVTRDMFSRLMQACANAEFRCILALARLGGLRCPSDVMNLDWSKVDFERGELRVTAPKTEDCPDGGFRLVPIFTELQPWLLEWREQCEPGDEMFPRFRDKTRTALANRLERLCRKIGVFMWEKPFQNMRASRETELLEKYPIHVVAKWMGHSPKIALEHYAQIVKEHHAAAVSGAPDASDSKGTAKPEAKSGASQLIETISGDKLKPKNGGNIRKKSS